MSNNLGTQVNTIGDSPAMVPNTKFAKVELLASSLLCVLAIRSAISRISLRPERF
jgi:hypothetical protein